MSLVFLLHYFQIGHYVKINKRKEAVLQQQYYSVSRTVFYEKAKIDGKQNRYTKVCY